MTMTEARRAEASSPPSNPRLTPVGWGRWLWRQLTSMRTALILLMLLGLAAVPGSLFPQRSSDPNGVVQMIAKDPGRARVLESFQLFDVYSSPWFSAIYLLLFVSLIGCVVPRIRHHIRALRSPPPPAPANLSRLPAYRVTEFTADADPVAVAATILRRRGYRVVTGVDRQGRPTVAAERGYLKETGNLVFHVALVGALIAIAIGGAYRYSGQRVVIEGTNFVDSQIAFDSFNPGRLVDPAALPRFSLTLNRLLVTYETKNRNAVGLPLDYTADVSTTSASGERARQKIRVNAPLAMDGSDIYLLGNGYAPTVTVRNRQGEIVFRDTIPFLPQDANLTSLGVVKVPDGLPAQVGLVGFLYPTAATNASGAAYSAFPGLANPLITFNVYRGNLGLDKGTPVSVYQLDTTKMTEIAGRSVATPALTLRPDQKVSLPDGLGTVEVTSIKRFASLEITHDPSQIPMAVFATLVFVGLAAGLFIPRRRIWVRGGKTLEVAGLARGQDGGLQKAVDDVLNRIRKGSSGKDSP